jgi:hypothetical protein
MRLISRPVGFGMDDDLSLPIDDSEAVVTLNHAMR